MSNALSNVARHYEQLLAEHYLWMFGVPFEQKVAEQRALLEPLVRALPTALQSGAAMDLGSGPGFQSVALAELGYSPVVAVDSSRALLTELASRAGSHPIEARLADITTPVALDLAGPASVIVCMGDTLTHLPSRDAVEQLFAAAFHRLASGGLFVLTYRDLTPTVTGEDRIFVVQSDDSRILTCFLEYASDDAVTVQDLLYTRSGPGWKLDKSSYQKLRLAESWVVQALRSAGFTTLESGTAGRLLMVSAQKHPESPSLKG